MKPRNWEGGSAANVSRFVARPVGWTLSLLCGRICRALPESGGRVENPMIKMIGLCALCAVWLPCAAAESGPQTWREPCRVALDDNAWKWNLSSWDQEKIFTFGDFQYTVYWDADRVLVLARRDLRDNTVETLRLPKFTLSRDDRHRNTCLGFSPADGRLHLSWDHHNNPLRYAKSRARFLTKPPPQLSAADIEPAAPMLSRPELESAVTYPRFLNDREGNLFFFYRIGSSGNGDNYLHRYNPEDASWTRLGMVFSSRGIYPPWENSNSRCAYLHDLVFDSRNRLHASWVYREISASWASNHDLHYAYSDDQGLTWCNNAGEKIADLARGDPIERADPGIVVRKIPVYSWLMNAGCMALDSKDRPHVITFKSRVVHRPEKLQHNPPPHIQKELRFVHYWRCDDGTWHGGGPIEPEPSGPGRADTLFDRRGDMVFDRDDNLYFFYPAHNGNGFWCLASRANDNWTKWSHYPLTGPDLTGRDAAKHDRRRWLDKGILSFTVKVKPSGFAILDLVPADGR